MGKKEKMLANELTDVKDIKNGFLYTKSGYIIKYLRLFPINISLKTNKEKETLCKTICSTFRSEKEQFVIFSIPRTVDMEVYLNSLMAASDAELNNLYRKKVLKIMIKEASNQVVNSTNYEHQFFIRVWAAYNPNEKQSEIKVTERLNEMMDRFGSIHNITKILDDVDILKINNLYNNNNTASIENYHEDVSFYPISNIKK